MKKRKDLISLLDKHNMDWGQKSKLLIFFDPFQRKIHLIYQEESLIANEHIQLDVDVFIRYI
jgi:hypothetical protein